MSKEKIIGLSVLGVLATTLAGVGAWRFMGDGGGPAHDKSAITAESDEKPEEEKSAGPTVLASATDSGNSEMADLLAGKSKTSTSWNTASSRKDAETSPPALPSGSTADGARYGGETSLSTSVTDSERHPSYMPKETIAASDEAVDPSTAAGEITGERYGAASPLTSEVLPEATQPDNATLPAATDPGTIQPGANDPANEVIDPYGSAQPTIQDPVSGGAAPDEYSAMSSRVPREATGETIQIVESDPPASMPEESVVDPAAEQLARRAADDAQFADAYAREQEAIQIPEAAIETSSVPDLSQPVVAEAASPANAASQYAEMKTDPAAPGRFKADARFAADARYVNEAAEAQNPSATSEQTTADPAAIAAATSPPEIATPTAGEAPYRATTSQPSYRDYGSNQTPVATQQSAPAGSAAAVDPYRSAPDSSPSVAAQPVNSSSTYGSTARMSSMSNAAASGSTSESGPTRENTGKYYVEPGDSFWTIAQKVYGSGGFFKALQEHNRARFLNPSDMQVGDEVLTPAEAELRERYSGLCPKIRVAKPGSPAALPASTQTVAHTAGMKKYEVQEGDTLYDIAKYELGDAQRWPEIFKLNRGTLGVDIDYVKPGTMLVLPTDAPLDTDPARSEDVLTRRPGNNQLK